MSEIEDYSTRKLKRAYLRAIRKSWRIQRSIYWEPKDKIRAYSRVGEIGRELERRDWKC